MRGKRCSLRRGGGAYIFRTDSKPLLTYAAIEGMKHHPEARVVQTIQGRYTGLAEISKTQRLKVDVAA